MERIQHKEFKNRSKKYVPRQVRKLFRNANKELQYLLDGDLFRQYPSVKTIHLKDVSYCVEIASKEELGMVKSRSQEHEYIERIMQTMPLSGVYIDVGAALGTHVIPPSIYSPSIHAYAIEPDNETCLALKRNIQLNDLDNVEIVNVALWNVDTTLMLQTGGRTGNAPRVEQLGIAHNKTHSMSISVSAYRLETLVKAGIIKAPDVLKIDTEGAEMKILEGMGDLRPHDIFVEIHPVFGINPSDITGFLGYSGYKLNFMTDKRDMQVLSHFSLESTKNSEP